MYIMMLGVVFSNIFLSFDTKILLLPLTSTSHDPLRHTPYQKSGIVDVSASQYASCYLFFDGSIIFFILQLYMAGNARTTRR